MMGCCPCISSTDQVLQDMSRGARGLLHDNNRRTEGFLQGRDRQPEPDVLDIPNTNVSQDRHRRSDDFSYMSCDTSS
jgi:hypothetical protein